MWRVVVPMEQRASGCSAFEPRYSKGTDDGRERKEGRATSNSGRKGRAQKLDLAIVVLATACSTGSQATLRSTRTIPRSPVACGAFTGESIAICWGLECRSWPFVLVAWHSCRSMATIYKADLQ